METRELLMNDYNQINDLIKDLRTCNADKTVIAEMEGQKESIRAELVKLESVTTDAKMKKAEIEANDKRSKIGNYITIGTFVISTGVTIWAVLKTFKFDQEGTVTSTLGRGILGSILPKTKK